MTDYWLSYYESHEKTRLFQKRIDSALRTIDQFMTESNRPYIGFSGGKDSSAMLILYKRMGLTDIPVFTQSDDFDWDFKYPTCQKIIAELGFRDYTYSLARESVLSQIEKMDFLTDSYVKLDKIFYDLIKTFYESRNLNGYSIGIRMQESKKRKVRILSAGQVVKTKSGLTACYPMGRLLGEDVFALIIKEGIPYMEVYDKHGDKAPHEIRFSWITNPELFQYGVLVWLRRYYPTQFNSLASINPKIRAYV